MSQPAHIPVLVDECVSLFAERPPHTFRDVTLGAGGHAQAFLETYPSLIYYDGSDRDPQALAIAAQCLKTFEDKIRLSHASFSDLAQRSPEKLYDGVLADLGVSSMQLDNLSRGFSFQGGKEDLDMRMDQTKGLSASDVLNSLKEEELGRIFREHGEEPQWKSAAKAIVHFRKYKKILSVEDLKEALVGVFPHYRLRKKIHPLTLIFQALRVYVNKEDSELKSLLESAISWLAPQGRLIIISFCSSEDRPVKWFFREAEASGLGKIITKKVVMPSYQEVRRNPRSRSAKLRCFEKASP
ncbi:Ribosomal RNA small subunit methyltransferase H,16S rRNA m(4)C1402 methyltranserfase,S-adenosyl-methyltransferase MraW,MraW methylase family [Chlamydia serpentis]|uniref:Ribosomal RNA small subunit methyltransferase H n=1 Tax=Chlamydia serpentis TaxID=1967782 RepID=A0A2R8FB84_9CHLA|nr:16S rRNA (cytosine(1402)-N(4))-methyltransferase RsmH [Chlamydia serpentis]SPN73556.1 Ribosomal RNA small subunit methyltransferase H,16S rRNA m(4)C1402 methyltranserfase,S-adenosyl-methyltransferase MraW,MraW methylase family [Chlamydia serpentis]